MANDNVIEVVLKVVDEASDKIKGFASTLGPMSKALGGVGAGLGAVGLGLGAVVLAGGALASGLGTQQLLAGLIASEKAAAKLDQALKNMGAVVGTSKKQIDGLATSLSNTTTVSSDVVKESAALLLSFGRVRGEAFGRTIKVANDMSAALGSTLPASIQQLGRALSSPAQAMGQLARSGVTFTQSQQKVIKELVATGQVGKAQAIILDELEKKYKGAGEAARNTLGGAITGLRNTLGDLVSGDTSSLNGATKAINDFSKTLANPEIKKSIDVIISAFVGFVAAVVQGAANIISWIDPVIRKIQELRGVAEKPINVRIDEQLSDTPLGKINAELVAKSVQLERVQAEIQRLATDRDAGNEQIRVLLESWKQQEKKLADEIKNLGFQRGVIRSEMSNKGPRTRARVLNRPQPETSEGEPFEPEVDGGAADAIKKMADERAKLLEAVNGIVGKWAASEKQITDAVSRGVLSQAEGKAALAQMNSDIRSSLLVEDLRFGEDIDKQVAIMVAAFERGAISAEEAGAAIQRLNEDLRASFLPEEVKQGQAWERQLQRIDAALKAHVINVDEAAAARKRLVDANLEEIEVTVKKIELPKPEDLMKPFRERMAQNLQDAFANAFMNIGKGWKSTVSSFLDGFKRILAEAAAMNLARALGLDKLAAGGQANGIIGKIIEGLFPRKMEIPGTGQGEESAKTATETAISTAGTLVARNPGNCAAECAGDIVGTVSTTMSDSVGAILDKFGGGILGLLKPLTSGLWKFLTGTLSKIWEFIKAAITAIRGMATASSGGGSGGGGGWIGTAIKVAGAFFGAAAGGGQLSRDRPTIVGEEGPEILMPMGGVIKNARQVAFATGGGQLSKDKPALTKKERSEPFVPIKKAIETIRQLAPVADEEESESPTSAGKQSKSARQMLPAADGEHPNKDKPTRSRKEGSKNALPVSRIIKTIQQLVPSARDDQLSFAAGGGQLSRNRPTLVGEEGPEMLMSGRIKNARQMAFEGGGAATINYAPVYNTVFEKAQDDKAMAAQFAAFVQRNDEKTKREIREMLKRNGQGRMTR